MEKVQVRFPQEYLNKIEDEVKEGKYPNKSEAIRDKVRRSYLLEAIVHMREANEGLDKKKELEKLEKARAAKYEEYEKGSD